MFTGIITDVGEIVAVEEKGTARHLTVACSYPAETLPIGASVCHMGVCLTVTSLKEEGGELCSLSMPRPKRSPAPRWARGRLAGRSIWSARCASAMSLAAIS